MQRHIITAASLLLAESTARTHVGDPFYVFTKYDNPTFTPPVQTCEPDEVNKFTRQKYQALKSMLEEMGAEIQNVEAFASAPDNFGMLAVSDIKKDDTIAFIPESCIITWETAANAQINQQHAAAPTNDKSLYRRTDLALWLLEERRNPDSAWKAYFDILPITTNFYPFWTPQERAYLEGSEV